MHRHWTEDELIARIYGFGPQDAGRESCSECRARWERAAAIRRNVLAMARQEQAPPARHRLVRWAPALAAACLLLLALVLQSPAPAPPASSESDAELLAEVYALASSPEAGAVTPIRALFEGGTQ